MAQYMEEYVLKLSVLCRGLELSTGKLRAVIRYDSLGNPFTCKRRP